MSVEGLQAVLDKEEIVSTPLANDLLDQPARVADIFRRHVRTYIPFARQATKGEHGISVAEFERHIIREVRAGGAVRGYLTGEYGYGKTSTALYLWDRAQSANLLCVPPFKLQNLKDLVIASYGWIRYELSQIRSDLMSKAEHIYNTVIDRSAETLATRYHISLSAAQQMLQEQPELLRLRTIDYIRFIEDATQLALEAGYNGLLILTDELQQYIEPAIHNHQRDPISALFDLVEAIRSRRGHLQFGLLLIIPPKDLSLLRDQRGDLVHRILQVSLDLNTVYDRWFPQRLWYRLAETFSFTEHRDRVISADCLNALGQIASRGDLSDGPRTVINVLRRATQRYIAAGYPEDNPYSPEDLIDDFLSGAITFDSARRIPHITAQALNHSMVKGHPIRERAIKWAAAFPQEGLPRTLQERLGVAETIDELAHSVLNDLLIEVGDRHSGGITLRGLDHVGGQTDWLTSAIRDFWRTFDQDTAQIRRWVTSAFTSLLTTKVFPSNQWKVTNVSDGGLFENAGLMLEGCFASAQQRFPNRRIAVQVLWQDEPELGVNDSAEIIILFRLFSDGQGLSFPQWRSLRLDAQARRIEVDLNIMRRSDNLVSVQIDQFVRPVILSTHLTPYLLLALYQFLDDKRANNLIPKEDLQFVQYGFQTALLDATFQLLFEASLDGSQAVVQERFIEKTLNSLLEQLYPVYSTFVRTQQWNNALQKYINVLQRHDLTYERQGQLPLEGTKHEIATMFGISDTGFDAFVENFSALIQIERPFPTRATARAGNKGAVRLTLHPLEQTILGWMQERPTFDGEGQMFSRELPLADVRRRASQFGYLPQEIDMAVKLLVARQMARLDAQRDVLYEQAGLVLSLEEVEQALNAWEHDLQILAQAFPDSVQIVHWQAEAHALHRELENQRQTRSDGQRRLAVKNQVASFSKILQAFVTEQHRQLRDRFNQQHFILSQFDRHLITQLDQTVSGSLAFGPTLDLLRIKTLHRYGEFDDAFQHAHTKLEQMRSTFQREDVALEQFVHYATTYSQFEREILGLRQKYEQFVQQAKIIVDWIELAKQAARLEEQLQALGSEASPYRADFYRWSQQVQDMLARQQLDDLTPSDKLREELTVMQNAVQKCLTVAEQRFATKQALYRQMMSELLGLDQTTLRPLRQYNPHAAAASEAQLLVDVKETLQGWCVAMGTMIRQLSTDLRSTLSSPEVTMLPDEKRQRWQALGIRLQDELRRLSHDLMEYEGRTEDLAILQDLQPSGSGGFRTLLNVLSDLKTALSAVQAEVAFMQQELQALQLSPAEVQVVAALAHHATLVELTDVRVLTSELTDTDFWQALQGLHAKRRIRIYCELLRIEPSQT